jgi:hypothetical protein
LSNLPLGRALDSYMGPRLQQQARARYALHLCHATVRIWVLRRACCLKRRDMPIAIARPRGRNCVSALRAVMMPGIRSASSSGLYHDQDARNGTPSSPGPRAGRCQYRNSCLIVNRAQSSDGVAPVDLCNASCCPTIFLQCSHTAYAHLNFVRLNQLACAKPSAQAFHYSYRSPRQTLFDR